jgi:type VI protein secretion system component Hcp
MAATLLYLQIDFDGKAVAGESTATDYENRIEIESFSWEMEVEHREESKDRETNSTVKPRMVKLEKFFDSASTVLMQKMRSGTPFKSARLTFADMVRIEGRAPKQIMSILLKDGFVEEVRLSTSGGKAISVKESISLSFNRLVLQYHPHILTRDTRGSALIYSTSLPCAKDN